MSTLKKRILKFQSDQNENDFYSAKEAYSKARDILEGNTTMSEIHNVEHDDFVIIADMVTDIFSTYSSSVYKVCPSTASNDDKKQIITIYVLSSIQTMNFLTNDEKNLAYFMAGVIITECVGTETPPKDKGISMFM